MLLDISLTASSSLLPDYPLCSTAERRDSYDASYPSTGGYHTARREVTFSPNTMDSSSYQSRFTQYHEMTVSPDMWFVCCKNGLEFLVNNSRELHGKSQCTRASKFYEGLSGFMAAQGKRKNRTKSLLRPWGGRGRQQLSRKKKTTGISDVDFLLLSHNSDQRKETLWW